MQRWNEFQFQITDSGSVYKQQKTLRPSSGEIQFSQTTRRNVSLCKMSQKATEWRVEITTTEREFKEYKCNKIPILQRAYNTWAISLHCEIRLETKVED